MKNLAIHRSGDGPTVVFVHGLDSTSAVWEPAIERLGDHHCVNVDLMGHGDAPAPDDSSVYERDSVLAELHELVSNESDPVVLVGHSLGGYLGLAYQLTYPGTLAAMVLVSTGPGFRDPEAREGWNERVHASAGDYTISPTAATIGLHIDSMVIDRMTEIDIPLALVIGSDDRAYLGANDYMEKKLAPSLRLTVEGARHYVMRSHPESVEQAIRHLTGVAPS
jgi:pimeloyl-ACP methyl ester carboxylesterase